MRRVKKGGGEGDNGRRLVCWKLICSLFKLAIMANSWLVMWQSFPMPGATIYNASSPASLSSPSSLHGCSYLLRESRDRSPFNSTAASLCEVHPWLLHRLACFLVINCAPSFYVCIR